MERLWALSILFVMGTSLWADVVSFDFKNASDRSAFTAGNPAGGIWAASSTNGYVLESPPSGHVINGLATLIQNTSFQMGQTGTATISINHFWFFPMNVNGARMSISSDGGSTWGYAGPGGFVAYGYNG